MKQILTLTFILITGCSSKPYVIKDTNITVDSPKEVYVVSHGWHTGFVVPASTIQKQLPQLKERFKNIPYIEFGWGDKGFYQAQEITSGLSVQAIFWPTESVMHVVAVPTSPDVYFSKSEIQKLCLSGRQYSLLISFIENSFLKDSNQQIIELKNGLYGDSQFYKGEGDYYLMNTCNKWTAKGLKSAELDIFPTFKLTASSIMAYLSDNNKIIYACKNNKQPG